MSTAAEIQKYIDGQLSRDRDIMFASYGDTPLDGGLVIRPGIREVDGRGTQYNCDTRRDFTPIVGRNLDGLHMHDINVRDMTADTDTDEGGRAAVVFEGCKNIRLSGINVYGFGASIVFRNCHDIILDACHTDMAWSWSIYFDNCTNVRVINTTTDNPYLDGFKFGNWSNRWSLVDCVSKRAGRAVVLGNDKLNGNGIDTYNGAYLGQIVRFRVEDCEGAGINLKTGPKDWQDADGNRADWKDGKPGAWHPTHDIDIIDCTVINPRNACIDLNSAASRSGMPNGEPHQSVPHHVTIQGGRLYGSRQGLAINAGRCNHGAITGTIFTSDEIRIDPGCVDFHDYSHRIAA